MFAASWPRPLAGGGCIPLAGGCIPLTALAAVSAHTLLHHRDTFCCRALTPLELLKCQDLQRGAQQVQERVPGISLQTAQIAIHQTLGDVDAAAAFLSAAMSKCHLPNTGDPNTLASLLLAVCPPLDTPDRPPHQPITYWQAPAPAHRAASAPARAQT